MELEHLCDGEYRYDPPPTIINPYAGREGLAFGGGVGRFTGERLTGEVTWSNFPRNRDDGVALPNLTGRVETDEGATLLFETRGLSVPDESIGSRRICCSVRFHTEAEELRWLNDVLVVEEGHIDLASMAVLTRLWVCVPEVRS
jgi:hypothetical protein